MHAHTHLHMPAVTHASVLHVHACCHHFIHGFQRGNHELVRVSTLEHARRLRMHVFNIAFCACRCAGCDLQSAVPLQHFSFCFHIRHSPFLALRKTVKTAFTPLPISVLTCAKYGFHLLPCASVSSTRTMASVPAPSLLPVLNCRWYMSPFAMGAPPAGVSPVHAKQPFLLHIQST